MFGVSTSHLSQNKADLELIKIDTHRETDS